MAVAWRGLTSLLATPPVPSQRNAAPCPWANGHAAARGPICPGRRRRRRNLHCAHSASATGRNSTRKSWRREHSPTAAFLPIRVLNVVPEHAVCAAAGQTRPDSPWFGKNSSGQSLHSLRSLKQKNSAHPCGVLSLSGIGRQAAGPGSYSPALFSEARSTGSPSGTGCRSPPGTRWSMPECAQVPQRRRADRTLASRDARPAHAHRCRAARIWPAASP
jgi:hypothetical protein